MTTTNTDRTELLLRTGRRSLWILLALILFIAATLLAHVLQPSSLLANWASREPWLLPLGMAALFFLVTAPVSRQMRADDRATTAMLADEFRQVNLARANRVALAAALLAQIPLALFASQLDATAAVTVMGVSTVATALAAFILSFLYFDRG